MFILTVLAGFNDFGSRKDGSEFVSSWSRPVEGKYVSGSTGKSGLKFRQAHAIWYVRSSILCKPVRV